jgi:hypothetical protein
MQRRRSRDNTFEQNIAVKAKTEAELAKLKPGPKDALLNRIRQLDTASHISDWLSSPGSAQPK